MPQHFSSPRTSSTSVTAWLGAAGHYEEYAYPPGRRGRDERHVHGDVQICLSLNFPGRYRTTRSAIDVPAGAISVVDAWEPHAAEDPCDRTSVARYWMLYVAKARWDAAADSAARPSEIGLRVFNRPDLVRAFVGLHRRSRAGASVLEEDERLTMFAARLTSSLDRRRPGHAAPASAALERAREFIRAYAAKGVTLADAARQAGLSPQHFAAGFRAQYGVPVHRFQTLMRLDQARQLLARGLTPTDAAAACGMTDQSHLTRHFAKYLGITPGRYRPLARVERGGHWGRRVRG